MAGILMPLGIIAGSESVNKIKKGNYLFIKIYKVLKIESVGHMLLMGINESVPTHSTYVV